MSLDVPPTPVVAGAPIPAELLGPARSGRHVTI